MKIAKLITLEEILISKNITLVADNYDFNSNLSIDYSIPSAFESFMLKGDIEYGVFRNILSSVCVPNWNTLSFEERKVCVKHFKYPVDITNDEYITYFSAYEDEVNWGVLIDKTTGTFILQNSIRGKRLVAMVKKVTYKLTATQVASIAASTLTLMLQYAAANFPHLGLWLSNGVYAPMGIDYSTNGFAQKSGYSDGLRDKLLDIINNGDY